ncbi:hypothetical protein GXP67_19610 [Rhodocytophaga rosea]|uniref:Uncharacterized protein n=1 Tax=Rhodocytophaga rosea TaxID=2704465 RepID=A0A6C0GM36_9BACT|nr:hypothetical protein [Rhodocytophaga rosea]QHT68693.1 hypothetical protein GXP67_19610 [Rhodocytophaga rosea]
MQRINDMLHRVKQKQRKKYDELVTLQLIAYNIVLSEDEWHYVANRVKLLSEGTIILNPSMSSLESRILRANIIATNINNKDESN